LFQTRCIPDQNCHQIWKILQHTFGRFLGTVVMADDLRKRSRQLYERLDMYYSKCTHCHGCPWTATGTGIHDTDESTSVYRYICM
jgi:hypothetical protein